MIIEQNIGYNLDVVLKWFPENSGNYNNMSGVSQLNVDVVTASGVNDKAYNHHPHLYEYKGRVHLCYSTANTDEEEPGQYVRYQYSDDYGVTWSSPVTMIEAQDDISKGWATAGRVCIPTGFAISNGYLYGVVDVNDKGGSNSSRTGVGILACRINDNYFGEPVWIENVDGTTNAPTAISGYPSYSFNSELRTGIRSFYSNIVKYTPTWYFSVPSNDIFYTRNTSGTPEYSEPSVTNLNNGLYLKLWRQLDAGANTKAAQFSYDGITYGDRVSTEIPDQPSRTKILNLSDNRVAVIGNNDSTDRTPLYIAFSNDGINYIENYNIDIETDGATYTGIYKTTGVQYPDAIELSNGKICVAYSVNKEDIRVSTFNKP